MTHSWFLVGVSSMVGTLAAAASGHTAVPSVPTKTEIDRRIAVVRNVLAVAEAEGPAVQRGRWDDSVKQMHERIDAFSMAIDADPGPSADKAVAAKDWQRLMELVRLQAVIGDYDAASRLAEKMPVEAIRPGNDPYQFIVSTAVSQGNRPLAEKAVATEQRRLDETAAKSQSGTQNPQTQFVMAMTRQSLNGPDTLARDLQGVYSLVEPVPGAMGTWTPDQVKEGKAALPGLLAQIRLDDSAHSAIAARIKIALGDYKGAADYVTRIDKSSHRDEVPELERLRLHAASGLHFDPSVADKFDDKYRPGMAAQIKFELAQAAAKAGNGADSAAIIHEMLKHSDPNRPAQPSTLIANAKVLSAGDPAGAAALFDAAANAAPDNFPSTRSHGKSAGADNLLAVAKAEWEVGLKKESAARLDQAIDRIKAGVNDPATPTAYQPLAALVADAVDLLLAAQRTPDAEADCRMILKFETASGQSTPWSNDFNRLHEQLVRALIRESKFDEAVASTKSAPLNVQTYWLGEIADAESNAGRTDLAKSLLESPAANTPQPLPVRGRGKTLTGLARAQLKAGDKTAAVETATWALRQLAAENYGNPFTDVDAVNVLFDAGGSDALVKADNGPRPATTNIDLVKLVVVQKLVSVKKLDVALNVAESLSTGPWKGRALVAIASAELAAGDRTAFDRDATKAMQESQSLGFSTAYDVVLPLIDELTAKGDPAGSFKLRSTAISQCLDNYNYEQVLMDLDRRVVTEIDTHGPDVSAAIAQSPAKPGMRARLLYQLAGALLDRIAQGKDVPDFKIPEPLSAK